MYFTARDLSVRYNLKQSSVAAWLRKLSADESLGFTNNDLFKTPKGWRISTGIIRRLDAMRGVWVNDMKQGEMLNNDNSPLKQKELLEQLRNFITKVNDVIDSEIKYIQEVMKDSDDIKIKQRVVKHVLDHISQFKAEEHALIKDAEKDGETNSKELKIMLLKIAMNKAKLLEFAAKIAIEKIPF